MARQRRSITDIICEN
ncbi:NinE family protein, partial [Escherichia coli]|nr:NinE family protein [Salmonella enterica]